MPDHAYILQPYTGRDSRYGCPDCLEPYEFSKYIDSKTGEILGDLVGKCNRIDKCGYHFTPKQYFSDNGTKPKNVNTIIPMTKPLPTPQPVSFIDDRSFNDSLKGYENNHLVRFLHNLCNAKQVNQLVKMYHIGTSSRYGGGTTIFWQVDINGNVRTGKLIKYDKSGHRIKNLNNWAHSVSNIKNFNLKQCFYGEHLLPQFPKKDVGIVESEKTAIIASIFIPEFIWLASGGAEGINNSKAKVLIGRDVTLFPDASKDGRIYKKWRLKAKQYGFRISDYLEQRAKNEQKADGVDIADCLINENQLYKGIEVSETKHEKDIETVDLVGATPQIPYNTPSPVANIDSKIETSLEFKGWDLVVKQSLFTLDNGDKIELVGIMDYGYCDIRKNHLKGRRFCRPCMLNCFHTIKINGKLQKREYTQLEILIMANNGQDNKLKNKYYERSKSLQMQLLY